MELLEYHFSHLTGNLYYDETENKYEMFSKVGKPLHLNYLTFKELFNQMNGRPNLTILETGIASAGTKSTYLFNEYIRKYGGKLWSVDINKYLVDAHQGNMCPGVQLCCDDSVSFINNWVSHNPNKYVDVTYLDSFDLDWYNPQPAALHGLKEFIALQPALKKNSLVLIDDTPSTPYWIDYRNTLYDDMVTYYNTNNCLPGKGMHVLSVFKEYNILLHNYQVLYKI